MCEATKGKKSHGGWKCLRPCEGAQNSRPEELEVEYCMKTLLAEWSQLKKIQYMRAAITGLFQYVFPRFALVLRVKLPLSSLFLSRN